MKLNLNLTPPETFEATVQMAPLPVRFVFRWRTRTEFADYECALPELDDVAAVMAAASGWRIADPFTAETVARLFAISPDAPRQILDTYRREMTGGAA